MGSTKRKNHYTHARGKFRKSAHLSRSFGGKFGGKNGGVRNIFNNISKSGGRHLHHTTILSSSKLSHKYVIIHLIRVEDIIKDHGEMVGDMVKGHTLTVTEENTLENGRMD